MNSFFEFVKWLLFSDIKELFEHKANRTIDVEKELAAGKTVILKEEPLHLPLEKEFLIVKVLIALQKNDIFIKLENQGIEINLKFLFVWNVIDNPLTDEYLLANLSQWTDRPYILNSEYMQKVINEMQYIIAITMYDFAVK